MKHKTRKIILCVAIVNITLFSIATLIISVLGNTVPDSLIQCFFSFWGVEMLALAGITRAKIKNNYESSFTDNLNQITEDNDDIDGEE